jgi:hypothetical protein
MDTQDGFEKDLEGLLQGEPNRPRPSKPTTRTIVRVPSAVSDLPSTDSPDIVRVADHTSGTDLMRARASEDSSTAICVD